MRCSAGARLFTIAAASGLCLLAAPRNAAAEWHITPMIGVTFAGRTTFINPQIAAAKRHADFGGAVTLLGAGIVGAEAIVVTTPGFFETDRTALETNVPRVAIENSRTTAVMANGVLCAPRRWTEYSLRPFVSGGFGLMHASVLDVSGLLPVRSNLGGFNVGGGATGFLSKRTGVRFDLRYFSSLHRTEQDQVAFGRTHLSYMTASVGLVLRR